MWGRLLAGALLEGTGPVLRLSVGFLTGDLSLPVSVASEPPAECPLSRCSLGHGLCLRLPPLGKQDWPHSQDTRLFLEGGKITGAVQLEAPCSLLA